ncbi:MAG: metal-dependent hydrolase [Saprospiraceae bacterium]|nr:metal-dependent hydrolase [Saprospiraceae bacterium]
MIRTLYQMDSLTHLALGACMGEGFAGKKLGKKAMLWGALAQSIPDIDFLAAFWMDTPSALLAHRGFTHSYLFCAVITPLLAFSAEKWHRPHNIGLKKWLLFFGGVIFIHLFIDAFNNYGVGWYEPFSHHRVCFHSIYVADPFFSIAPGLACLAMIYFRKNPVKRRRSWQIGLAISGLYLVYCLINKAKIDFDARQIFEKQEIVYDRYFTTPAPLQNWLWFIVAGDQNGYHVGFRSLFDKEKYIDFQYFPRNDHLLDSLRDHVEVQKLIRFSQDYYSVEQWHDTLVFNDLRFGQMLGWEQPRGRFVFHYFLNHPDDNTLVVQRGRFKGWNYDVVKGLITRIIGIRPTPPKESSDN